MLTSMIFFQSFRLESLNSKLVIGGLSLGRLELRGFQGYQTAGIE